MAKPRPAKPRPPRRSRVESALASIEARHRGDARAAAVVRAARRASVRNMLYFAVVSSKLFCKVCSRFEASARRGAARQLSGYIFNE